MTTRSRSCAIRSSSPRRPRRSARDRPYVRELAHKRMSFTRAGADRMRHTQEAIEALTTYLTPLLDARVENPLNDLLSVVGVAERDHVFTRDETLANAMVLIDAG